LAAKHATGQLDPTDAAIQRLNDTQQARARRSRFFGAWGGQIGGG
jgi:hypothetical protein